MNDAFSKAVAEIEARDGIIKRLRARIEELEQEKADEEAAYRREWRCDPTALGD